LETYLSNQKLKPQFDKAEIAIFASALLIVTLPYLVITFRFPLIDYSLLVPITTFVGVGLLLIAIAYHKDRESDWKRKQQSQTQSTLQR
jgi:hypothetical protein